MNAQIQHRLRSPYRQTERAIEPAANQIVEDNTPTESDTLRNEIITRDGEVINKVELLIDSILEDIADPNRCDSFSEFEEAVLEETKDVIRNNPEWYHRNDYETRVRQEIDWRDPIVDLSTKETSERIEEILATPWAKGQIESLLMDMQQEKEYRENPHNSRGISEKNIVGVG